MKQLPKVSQGKLTILSIGVDAPIFIKKAQKGEKLPDPYTPDDIALVDLKEFRGLGGEPGKYGNAIFTGHVDSGFEYCNYGTVPPPCKAVLWDLDKLKKGDIITVYFLKNYYTYKVVSNKLVDKEGIHWDNILKATRKESMTIISCNGKFDESTHDYMSRQVMRAERIS